MVVDDIPERLKPTNINFLSSTYTHAIFLSVSQFSNMQKGYTYYPMTNDLVIKEYNLVGYLRSR